MKPIRPYQSGAIAAAVMGIAAASSIQNVRASEVTSAAQWNIMVIPSRESAFSGQASDLFNNQCASCHSKDGRAQTPVARQRRVQNLSESKATDVQIVEQILEGTHNKANTFRMPPFKEKLSRAQVQSLVPLVRAFRPISREQENQAAGTPRLVGMFNGPYDRFAVLEEGGSSNHYFILREMESHDGVTLLKLRPKQGMVKLNVGGTNPIVTLALEGWAAGYPRVPGVSGFLDRLGVALNNAPKKLDLNKASTDLVLFLYSQFTGRTLIRSPRLPALTFDLDVGAPGPDNPSQLIRIRRTLRVKGIRTIEDGEKFILVVPESEAETVKPHWSQFKASTVNDDGPEPYPGGAMINLPNAGLDQVVKLYSELTGRGFDQPLPPTTGTVNFTTQTPLSRQECVYALETLLRWHGLEVIASDNGRFKVVLLSDASARP